MKNKKEDDEGSLNFPGSLARITIISDDPLNQYNPFVFRDKRKQYSDIGAFAHLIRSGLGSGILAMPMAFKYGGLVVGVIGTVLVGSLCAHCMLMLVGSAHTLCVRVCRPVLGMPEVADAAFNTGPPYLRPWAPTARRFVKIVLFGTYMLGISEYIIFISSSIQRIADNYWEEVDERVYMAALCVPLIPLCLVRQLRQLVPLSVTANTCILVGFLAIMYYLFTNLQSTTERRYGFESWEGVPIFISTVLFAMEGIGTVLPIENTMRNPRKIRGCYGILSQAMCLVVVVYTCIGFLGYLTFGDSTRGSVTLNLPEGEILAQVVNGMLALAILCTCPLQFYVPCGLAWAFLRPHLRPECHRWLEVVLRVTLVCICVTVAIAVPNLELVISLMGSVCFSTLGLLIPAMVDTATHMHSTAEGLPRMAFVTKNAAVVLLSIFTAVAGVYASLA